MPQPMLNPTPVPSNVPRPQPLPSSSGPPLPNIPISSGTTGDIRIKSEPGYDLGGLPQSNGIPQMAYGNQAAQQRAAEQLQQRFGAQANTQISQLQARAAMAGQGQSPQQRPQGMPISPPLTDQQMQQMADHQRQQQQAQEHLRQQQQYQHLQQAQQRAGINNAQTDGAGDWDAMVAERRADAQQQGHSGMYSADMTIRQQVEQMGLAMEAGGLMLPLTERPKQPTPKKRRVAVESAITGASSSLSELRAAQLADVDQTPSKLPQYDGGNESDSDDKAGIKDDPDPDLDDEDAINSDLDDPDDNVIEEQDEDGNTGQIMLCTYDKVQRVKNKWKCTLKDGVLTTGGKE